MSHQLEPSALLLIALAGLMQGTFVVPMKLMRQWKWENSWLAFCFLGFIILPSSLAVLTVPRLAEVLSTTSIRSLALVMVFGVGWGCGSTCFGMGVERLGVGLALSIILGITSSLGSLLPWVTAPVKPVAYSVLLWLGILTMLSGVVICSAAGRERERSRSPGLEQGKPKFRTGLAIAISSGVLSCFLNFGFAYGESISRRARDLGASIPNAPNVLWMLLMMAGFLANVTYCSYCLIRNKSWDRYRKATLPYLGSALIMAVLWVGSLVAYGQGANKIGNLGPSVGWAILMCMNIVASNVWGVITGEWRGAGRKATRTMTSGVGMLLGAVVIFAWAAAKI